MLLRGRKTRLIQAAGICVTAAFLFVSESADAKVPMLCKVSLGGAGIIKGFVFVTLSNLTTSTIPKGQTLFAKKGNKTIRFQTAKPIPENGIAVYKTSERAFQVEGDCEGWY